MATPTLAQARSHYHRQRLIVANAVRATRALMRRDRPLPEVASSVAAYQLASATASATTVASMADSPDPLTVARAFAGVSSYGFPVLEPMIAVIDKRVPAPVEAVPANWWADAEARVIADFTAELEQLIASEVADAGRTASQVEFVTRPDWQNYVRMLNPPSCARCALLAGRIYRDDYRFERHPDCDCVMIPVQNWAAAESEGYVASFEDAWDAGHIRGSLSKADTQAINDGADPAQVVNARRGLRAPGITTALTTEVFGRKVKATTEGTTKRAAWRKANPTRLVRLRPESIYAHARDRDDAIRLLRLYGYIH